MSAAVPGTARVGYVPHHPSLRHPGDRRRFVFFARETGLEFEVADVARDYDLVYLTSSCDVSAWIGYKRRRPRTRLVFELIDSYLLEHASAGTYLKGAVRYLTGKDSRLHLDYRKAFLEIIRIADVVVCSTPLQKAFIERYNPNVHVSLDFFEDEIAASKTDHRVGDRVKVVWEGQSYTLENIAILRDAFRAIAGEIELHVITDETIPYPFGMSKRSRAILDGLGIDYHFHEWRFDTFAAEALACDLALIPLDRRKPIMWQKPENKLLFFWQLGLPAVTSPSPAYTRVMDAAGVAMYAADTGAWIDRIVGYKRMPDVERDALMARTAAYVATTHSRAVLLERWRQIFEFDRRT